MGRVLLWSSACFLVFLLLFGPGFDLRHSCLRHEGIPVANEAQFVAALENGRIPVRDGGELSDPAGLVAAFFARHPHGAELEYLTVNPDDPRDCRVHGLQMLFVQYGCGGGCGEEMEFYWEAYRHGESGWQYRGSDPSALAVHADPDAPWDVALKDAVYVER